MPAEEGCRGYGYASMLISLPEIGNSAVSDTLTLTGLPISGTPSTDTFLKCAYLVAEMVHSPGIGYGGRERVRY